VAIGPPASGKTVYLAALYDSLIDAGRSLGPGIKATVVQAQQRGWLREVHDQMMAPQNAAFPAKTAVGEPIREVTFRFTVSWTQRTVLGRARRREFPVFNVSYVDYAGEIPSKANRQDKEDWAEFKAHLDRAQVLLGIIDGIELLRFMEDRPGSWSFIHQKLRPTVEYMEESGKILHFLITKWDVFDGRFTLPQVREKLLGETGARFGEFVAENTAQATWFHRPLGRIRLIPVSSIGKRAVLVPGITPDLTVVKIDPDRPATPVNVEVPLIAAVYDVCELAEELLRTPADDAEVERAGTAVKEVGTTVQPVLRSGPDMTIFGVGLPLRELASFVATKGQEVVRVVGHPAVKVSRAMGRSVRRVRAHGLRGGTSDLGALYYLMHRLRESMRGFAEREPGSTLTAEFSRPERALRDRADRDGPVG
jgi:hypothetical protein